MEKRTHQGSGTWPYLLFVLANDDKIKNTFLTTDNEMRYETEINV